MLEITCRYCLTNDINNMISPCLCNGTSKYVHKNCLLTWINSRRTNLIIPILPNNLFKCEICNYNYHIVFQERNDNNPDICIILFSEYIKTIFCMLCTTLLLTLMFSPLDLMYHFIKKEGIVFDYINLLILNQIVLGAIWLFILIFSNNTTKKWFKILFKYEAKDNKLFYIIYLIFGFPLWMFYDVTAKTLYTKNVVIDILDRPLLIN